MRAGFGGRLSKLETVYKRPAGCVATGPVCRRHLVVGDGSDDPPLPASRHGERCERCGRPIFERVVVVVGVDVDRI